MRVGVKWSLAIVGVAVLAFAFMPTAGAKISDTDSPHNFSTKGYGTDQICIFCHTPHNAQTVTDAPLWNHAVTTASFTLYSSATLDATPGQPAGASKLCLSCHDGTVAIDAYGGNAGGHSLTSGDDAFLGTDLSNDHPISFTYDSTLATADGELATPTAGAGGAPGSVGTDSLPLFGTSGNQLECATCHDVHDTDVPAGAGDLLRVNNTGSALCLNCHQK